MNGHVRAGAQTSALASPATKSFMRVRMIVPVVVMVIKQKPRAYKVHGEADERDHGRLTEADRDRRK